MTAMEWVVLAVGLLLGYWLVQNLIGGAPKAGEQDAPAAAPEAAPGREKQPWHLVLDVPPDAGADEIRAAYQRLAAQYAPNRVADLGPELREIAERKSSEIDAAYREAMRARGAEP